MTEAIFILYQCNLFIGIVSSAIIAFGNAQQEIQARAEYNRTVVISSAGARVKKNAEYTELKKAENDKDKKEKKKSKEDNKSKEETKETKVEEDTDYTIEPETESEPQPEPEYEEYYEHEIQSQSVFYDGFDSSFKAYMDYRCITDTGSVQYAMQQQAYTDSRGFRRIGDDYCIALGTGFTSGCGERFAIYLDSGYSFTAVVSDVKSDMHTDYTNCYVPRGENSGNVVEFIIDTDYAEGSMLSSGNAGYYADLSGNVTAIEPI